MARRGLCQVACPRRRTALTAPRASADLFVHPLHAILLAFPIALSSSSVATDITYLNSAVVQWSHFSAWLIAATALFAGLTLAWALLARWLGRRNAVPGRRRVYLVLVAAVLVLSIINSFQHAGDAWASVGTAGLLMSIVTTVLALAAGWIAYSAGPAEPARRLETVQ